MIAIQDSSLSSDAAAMELSYGSDIKELMNSSDQLFDCKRMAYGGFRQLIHA
jgi:uncharacterized protein YbaA (DUF1428 family)